MSAEQKRNTRHDGIVCLRARFFILCMVSFSLKIVAHQADALIRGLPPKRRNQAWNVVVIIMGVMTRGALDHRVFIELYVGVRDAGRQVQRTIAFGVVCGRQRVVEDKRYGVRTG